VFIFRKVFVTLLPRVSHSVKYCLISNT